VSGGSSVLFYSYESEPLLYHGLELNCKR